MPKILLVEDDLYLGQMMVEGLRHEGFTVEWVQDGFTALRRVVEESYDLVILDIMLPKFDGMKVCRKIRETKDIPIIMVTARSQIEDKVEGLSAGADDYITKPFSFKELSARIQAVLRRYRKKEGVIMVGDLRIDPSAVEVTYRGQKIHLTRREFELLKLLAENANRVVSREEIYAKVWGYSHEEGSNIVDVYIKNLRNKLGDKPPRLIQTVRGYGYILRTEDVGQT